MALSLHLQNTKKTRFVDYVGEPRVVVLFFVSIAKMPKVITDLLDLQQAVVGLLEPKWKR